MEDFAIQVTHIGKKYQLYKKNTDRIKEIIHPFRKKYHQDYYALNDISFALQKGKTLGLIGRNGSGKSTLLKIICGLIQPSHGEIRIDGSISALLELGAGFNPELTGRENVYFNTSITGLTREEVDNIYDEIIEFADIGDYINQPMKTYSSGMFVRLAFSVAIIVDPDILIVDEALSVGDLRFQQKCLRRMNDFKKKGKTIVFVSHDLNSVMNFCDEVIWLKDGLIHRHGETKSIVNDYVSYMTHGEVSKKNEPSPDASDQLPSDKNQDHLIRYHFDEINQSVYSVELLGWAYADQLPYLNMKTVIQLISELETINTEAESVLRLDLNETRGMAENIDIRRAGFSVQVDKKLFNTDQYRIGILINDFNSDRSYSIETDKTIKMMSSSDRSDYLVWDSVKECSYFGEGGASISGVAFYTEKQFKKVNILEGGEDVIFFADIIAHQPIENPGLGIRLTDEKGIHLFSITSFADDYPIKPLRQGEKLEASIHFKMPLLHNGKYFITVALSDGNQDEHVHHIWIYDAYIFQINREHWRHKFGILALERSTFNYNYH